MANKISKIYVNNVDQFREFYNWCKLIRDDCREKTEYDILECFYEISEDNIIAQLEIVRQERLIRREELTRLVNLPFKDPEFQRNFCYWEKGAEHTPENAIIDLDSLNQAKAQVFEDPTFSNIEEAGVAITNFPQAINRYLIQNCPIEFVQERLKEQCKDKDTYKDVKLNQDVYSKPYIYEPCTKLKVVRDSSYFKRSIFRVRNWRNKYTRYWRNWRVEIWDPNDEKHQGYGSNWKYNSDKDFWVNTDRELKKFTETEANVCKSEKALIRKIFKWKLPKGLIIYVYAPRFCDDFKIITK